jgi:hypothetical protein
MKQCKEHEMHISYIFLIFSFIDKEKLLLIRYNHSKFKDFNLNIVKSKYQLTKINLNLQFEILGCYTKKMTKTVSVDC